MIHTEAILVLDFGSQYTQLIARRIRELGVYSEIKPYYTTIAEIKNLNPKGIILSGGPSSVYADNAPLPSEDIFRSASQFSASAMVCRSSPICLAAR